MKLKYCLPVIIILSIGTHGGLAAEEPLTLQAVISKALQNNKKYKINVEKTVESRKKVLESWGMLWPQFQSDVAYTPENFKAGLYSSIKSETRISIVDGQISINPGVFYNTLQASRDAHIVAEYSARQTRAESTLQVINYFYQLILSEDNAELEKMSTRALKDNYNIIAEGSGKGTFTKYDYLQAKVSYNNEQTKLINAENSLSNAKANLNVYIGRKINTPIEADRAVIDTTMNEVPRYLLDEKAENKLVENFIGMALKNRPEIFQIKNNKKMEIHNALASESLYLWPTFNVTSAYGFNKVEKAQQSAQSKAETILSSSNSLTGINNLINNSAGSGKFKEFWSVSLGATYRWGALLPIDQNNARAQEARSRARQHDLELEDFVDSVNQEIAQAYLQLKSAARSLSWQKGNVATAEALYATAVKQFRSGTINNTQLLDAINSMASARALYVQALHDFQQAKAMINKAIGEDYFPY